MIYQKMGKTASTVTCYDNSKTLANFADHLRIRNQYTVIMSVSINKSWTYHLSTVINFIACGKGT